MTAGRGILRVVRARGLRRRGLVAMTDAAIGVMAFAGVSAALALVARDGVERVRDERLAAAVSVAGEAAMARVREADGEALSGRFALSGTPAPSGYRLAGCVMDAPDGSRIVAAGLEGRDGAPPPALPPMSDSLLSQPLGTALGQVTADGARLEGRGWSIDAAPLRAKCGFPHAGSIAFTARITPDGGRFLWRTNAPDAAFNRMPGDLAMGGGDVTGASLIAADRADVDETLYVRGIATVAGALDVGGDADFEGGITADGALHAATATVDRAIVRAGMVKAGRVDAGGLTAGRVRSLGRVSAKKADLDDLVVERCEGCK